jgi:hypothetical protein
VTAPDHLAALRLLRGHGWVVAIQAGLGFALFHQRAGEFDARLDCILGDLDAYVAEGSNWIKQDWLYLFDPQRETTDVSAFGDRTLENLSARATDYWNRCANHVRANQNVYHPGKYPPLQHTWEVLHVDRLPAPSAPFVGERDDRAAYPELAHLLGPVSLPADSAAARTDTRPDLGQARGQPAPAEPPFASRTTGESAPNQWTHWSEILPAINEWTGWSLKTARSAQRRLKKYAVSLASSGDKGTPVTLHRSELERLPRAPTADPKPPTRRRAPTAGRQ